MSTAAGIAAVTAVLKDVLLNGLVDHDATAMVGNVMVTAQPPDRIALPEQNSQLNLFLYLVTPNPGWRNVGLPARDSAGELVSAPPLALDLHYLLSAYGTKDFHAEILLGYAMQLFHEMPVLTRSAIRNAFSPSLSVNGAAGPQGKIPAELRNLFQSGLADQIEQIKITPSYLNTEEMFKLWMAFQAPYRPAASYCVSVVLIDSTRKGKAAPPVRRRAIFAVPFAQPAIEQILSQAAPGEPFLAGQRILPASRVALVGKNLQGTSTRVAVGDQEVAAGQQEVTATRIEFSLPAGLLPGVQPVRVVHRIDLAIPPAPPAWHDGLESNVAALVLSPEVTNLQANVTTGQGQAADVPRGGEITLDIAPAVGKRQRVLLLLNERDPPDTRPPFAYRFAGTSHSQPASPDVSTSLAVSFAGVHTATYLVRVQVDGAESPLAVDAAGNYVSPNVSIP
jgi:hypothetical protein